MFRLVTLLWLATAALGTPFQDGERIAGGEPAAMKDHPYQLSLHIGEMFECGAVIISPLWALTAAQCAGGTVVNMMLRAGSIQHGSRGTEHSVTQKVVHLNYNLATKDYDIALLKVDPPFEFVDNVLQHILPVSLPVQGAEGLPDDTDTTVLGWGFTAGGGEVTSALQYVNVKLTNIDKCKTLHGSSAITPRMFCAADVGKDACQGDTGGPLVLEGAEAKDDVLLGLVSWGRGCAISEYPHVYTNVTVLRSWILANSGV